MRAELEMTCDLCGSSDLHFVFSERNFSGTYSSFHCRYCNLHQTLGDIDPVSPDYIDLQEGDLDEDHVFIQRRHKLTAFEQWQNVLVQHGLTETRGKRLLDIGCGVGGFLEFASGFGMECYGFDASRAHIEEARKSFPNVRHAESISDYCAQLGGDIEFDLITMWDVFEHIRNPDDLLNEIAAHLSPQGLLYISVPSGALNKTKVRLARVRGREEIGLIPWEHVFYYTPKSLRLRFEKAGLDVIEVSGVVPYQRKSLTPHEVTRRVVHHTLRSTPYALQIYGLAKRSS